MIHTIEIKVRGYHADMFGHVNNARYLEFLEEARWTSIEEADELLEFMKSGYTYNIVNININYRKPALPDSILIIETELASLGSRSGIVHQTIKLKDTDIIIADADITFVIFDVKRKKAAPLEGELLSALKKL